MAEKMFNPFGIYRAYNDGYNQALKDIKASLDLTPEQLEFVECLMRGDDD